LGVIPGGQSFQVPRGTLTNVTSQGTGFTWVPSVRAGNTILLVGGDDRSPGDAGSTLNNVSPGINPNSSCLNDQSPSSTPGSPAGGAYPTSSSGAGTGGSGSNGNGGSSGSHSGGGSSFVTKQCSINVSNLRSTQKRRTHRRRRSWRHISPYCALPTLYLPTAPRTIPQGAKGGTGRSSTG
jgi:hypothetical protein